MTLQLNRKQILYASQILYIVSMGLSRCSTAFFLRSLSRAKEHNVVGLACASVAVLWAVASILAIALRGKLSAPWEGNEVLVCYIDIMACSDRITDYASTRDGLL